ncbi:MAG: four-carbon acid sugar kinase family protein [Chloroflexota bacterium]
MTLAILADDLTGACDSSVPFARRGLSTRVLLSTGPVPFGPADGTDVVAVDADTRRLSRRLAVARTTQAARALRSPGVTGLFKKVDSTLRGHVGPELFACMRAWDAPLALLCPAFPATGRWVQSGEVFVDRRGSLGKVATLAGLPADRRTGHLDIATLRSGGEAVSEALASLAAAGARVVVADADTPGHLTALVEAASRYPQPVLLAGAGGLAAALAESVAQTRGGTASGRTEAAAGSIRVPDDGPPWLVVAGSQTEVTGHQVVELARAGAEILELDVDALLARPSLALAAGRQAAALLQRDVTPVIRLVVTPDPAGVLSRGLHLDERAARALARACRTVTERAAPGGLFLTGGSTARACLLALGVSGLRLEREPLPGIAAGVALGGAWDGRPVITKSGGFGAPDAVRRLVRPRSPGRITLPSAAGSRGGSPVA